MGKVSHLKRRPSASQQTFVIMSGSEGKPEPRAQWWGEFVDRIGWGPSVSKSNRLHVDIPCQTTVIGLKSVE